jgi:hypothetical protein
MTKKPFLIKELKYDNPNGSPSGNSLLKLIFLTFAVLEHNYTYLANFYF